LGSFSKIIAPGLRCGWISGNPNIVGERIGSDGALVSGGGPAPILTEAIRSLIRTGNLSQHIVEVVSILRSRMHALINAIDGFFSPAMVSFHKPCGGYFVYLKFDNPVVEDTRHFQQFISSSNVKLKFLPGNECSASNKSNSAPSRFIRIAFSFYTELELKEAVQLLRECYDKYCLKRQGN
jgi:DNA-binding transcriptional MocR family regulator